MAEKQGGSAPWLAFLAGIVLVAIIAVGIVAYNGALEPRDTAQLEIEAPNIDINPPEVDLPNPPPEPIVPPTAEE
ncbi:MAG: hypothetical protein R3C16_06320 [Hyphomonadaceae bacterium]